MNNILKQKLCFTCYLGLIIFSILQYSIGATFSKTGEQLSSGLPLSTLALFLLGGFLLLLNFRKLTLTGFRLSHFLLITAVLSGLLGFPVFTLKHSVKEIVQIYEIYVISYLVFAVNKEMAFDVFKKSSLYIISVLLLLQWCYLNGIFGIELSNAKLEAFIVLLVPFVSFYSVEWNVRKQYRFIRLLPISCALVFTDGGLFLAFLIVFLLSSLIHKQYKITLIAVAISIVASCLPIRGDLCWDSLNPSYNETHTKRLFIEYNATLEAPANFPLGIGVGMYKDGINYLKSHQELVPDATDMKVAKDSNSQYQIYIVESGILSLICLLVLLVTLFISALKLRDDKEKYLRISLIVAVLLTALFCVILSKGIGIIIGAILAITAAKQFSKNERWIYPIGIILSTILFFTLMVIKNKECDNKHHKSIFNRAILESVFGVEVAEINRSLTVIDTNRDSDSSKVIIVEAEDTNFITSYFSKVPSNNSSGNMVIEIPNNLGKGKGSAGYSIEIPEDGEYIIFVRAWWEDGCSNSVQVVVDNSNKFTITSEIFKKWHIQEGIKPVKFKKGTHKLVLKNLEDGIKIDYIGVKISHQ